ncbi:hypothetical protein ABE073_17005 [Lederbergia citrisecunda]|uniref:tetratricopeptide repeat protein n=1 Tax=Lederbergia citrisecunda TaxID=2833583 RepID=UPI003D2CF8C0
MKVSDSARKYIVIGLALFVIFGIITAMIMGNRQDKIFQTTNMTYSLMVQELQEGQYSESLAKADTLDDSKKSSEIVNYLIAIAAINTGEIDKAILHMQKVLDLNPYKVEDSMFMLQYAEMLVQAEKKSEAAQVLKRCEVLRVPESYPEYKERILQLQQQLGI